MKKTIRRFLTVAAAAFLASAAEAAAESYFEATPTGWLLLHYLDTDAIQLFYTPSSCASGLVYLPTSASNNTKNRFWSLIVSARLSNSTVGIHYNTTNCEITSFYLKG